MKKIFEEYASYNLWADQRLSEAILQIPEETTKTIVLSSFGTIQLTLLHLLNASSTWWRRLNLIEDSHTPGNDNHSIDKILSGLLEQSTLWKGWVKKSTGADLEQKLIYTNSKKEQFEQPIYEILLHVFNHNTYHRGQLVTMMRQLNLTTIPATDFILFTRDK